MLLLVACNTDHQANDKSTSTNSEEITDRDKDTEKEDGNASTNNDEIEKEVANHSPNNIEEIFNLMKEAAQSIESVTITGTADVKSTVAGLASEGKVDMRIEAVLDPFIQHAVYTTISGEGGDTEWYATDEEMFLYIEGFGWSREVHPISIQAASLIHRRDYFDHFISNKDLFELTEDNGNYIITYTGSDEQYKEVFYEGHNLAEMLGEMTGIIDDTEMAGSVEMKVSKDSFLVVEQHSIYEARYKASANNVEIETNTVHDGTYTYSYNEANDVEIPKEVIDNAM